MKGQSHRLNTSSPTTKPHQTNPPPLLGQGQTQLWRLTDFVCLTPRTLVCAALASRPHGDGEGSESGKDSGEIGYIL